MMGETVQRDLVANHEESSPKTDSKHVALPESTTTPDAVFVIEEAVSPIEVEVEETAIVLDGGWGWIVSVAAMCCSFIVFVIKGSSGLFLIALINKFDEPVWKLTLVGSILNGLSLLSAPISSMLLIYFSHRKVAIIAGLIGFTGAILGAFSTSSDMMITCYGILGGLAVGFGYFTGQIMVTLYFSKKRATALGIASCGTGLGTCVGNIMVEKLLQTYGLTGTLLMIAGMMFNMVVCGALYRPLPTKMTLRHNPEYKTTTDWDSTRQGITNQAFWDSESSLDVVSSTVMCL
ncbi:monocarboxylate transporter 9-like [Octopus bimaculoides]|uniref:monocarboxylate transporter 9-like n=1 Tax=Octopus bimaculoides TaxID=37653 RepID=UPI00071C31DE|nr:monocarboxylate transporter 9-like [Octopus bimaculoides]|eukprot:XP_014771647.1 PREDICTED: monocarboxylate transporter 9-like [Octopus bimaculoides]